MSDNNIVGNSSSIFKTCGLMIAGYLIPIFIAKGINFYGQETQIIQILGTIIGFILSYIDMKYTNSFFKKNITIEDYINYGEKHFNLQTVECECDNECEDCTCNEEYNEALNHEYESSDDNDSC